MENKSLLATALVGKTHGLNGFLKIVSLSGEYDHLASLDQAEIRTREGRNIKVEVEDVLFHKEDFLMKFSSFSTPEKARVLSGGVMYITRDRAPALEDGEYYIADLYGLKAEVVGKVVGEICDTSEGSQALLLHIRMADGQIRLVPNMEPFVGIRDFEKGSIEILMPEVLE